MKPKTKSVLVHLNIADFKAAKKLLAKLDLTFSAWVRSKIRELLKREETKDE